MARSTAIITDRNFRITIPYEIRIAEDLKHGDIIEIDIVKYSGLEKEIDHINESIKNLNDLIDSPNYWTRRFFEKARCRDIIKKQ